VNEFPASGRILFLVLYFCRDVNFILNGIFRHTRLMVFKFYFLLRCTLALLLQLSVSLFSCYTMLQISGKLFHTFPATQKVQIVTTHSSGLVNVIFTVKITIITHFQSEIHEKLQTRTLFLQIEKCLLTGC
jgi:hypothetical protein